MGPLTITLLIVVALLVVFFWFAGRYADVLWYDQLGILQVLLTEWGAGAIMFAIGLVAMAVPLYVNLQIAYRARPVYAKLNEQLDRYQQVIEPIRRGAMVFVPAIFGLFAGVALISSWQTVLMWMNSTPFGETDPVFNLDVSFYIFQLPFFRGVVAFVSAVVLLSLILTAATLYLYGGIRVTGREVVISKSARTHIAILAGLYMLVQAVSFWLDRYAALHTLSGRWTGVLYTEANATIPGQGILARPRSSSPCSSSSPRRSVVGASRSSVRRSLSSSASSSAWSTRGSCSSSRSDRASRPSRPRISRTTSTRPGLPTGSTRSRK